MLSPFFYHLESEHINQKVGLGDKLRFPNDAFHTVLSIAVFVITVVLIILLATQKSLHFSFFLLHVDFCILIFVVVVCIRCTRDWVNTVITAVDSVFISEEVLRRKFYGEQQRQRQRVRKQPEPTYVEVHEQDTKKNDFLSVDMGKLDAAFKGGMFNRS